eukprot:15325436-Ditylum_brightwellii.AAC.1
MKEHGKMAINTESGYKTTVRFEQVVSKEYTTFNVCAALVNILTVMKQVDPTLYIQSATGQDVWKKIKEIMKGNAFNTVFNIKQDSSGHRPSKFK